MFSSKWNFNFQGDEFVPILNLVKVLTYFTQTQQHICMYVVINQNKYEVPNNEILRKCELNFSSLNELST